jgi:HPt (histidine-containing phosphotransfer) domain-containing protein
MNSYRAFDPEVLLEQTAGDAALAAELIQICLVEMPGLRDQIQTAVKQRDAQQLKYATHTLAGSLINFGAQRAVESLHALEAMGRANNLDGVEDCYDALRQALADFEREITAYAS